ncbi:MAG: response regulator [Patescibacteria group bacterium]|nr:response regulator [Patescibacteria group bacterium]
MVNKRPKKNKGKILFAEDDKFLAEMFRQKLKIEGYKPIIAHTAISAILALKNEKPKAIILDIVLPDSDCWMIMEYLKRKGKKKVPVMLLTNWGNNEYRQKAKELKADDFMVKASTTPQEIVKRMEELIKKYQSKNK